MSDSAKTGVLYTCLFGDYERINELRVPLALDWDAICFTDNPNLRSTTWKIRVVNPELSSSIYQSRHPKILPHRYLAEYQISLYIDNAITLVQSPELVFEKLIGAKTLGLFQFEPTPRLIWNFVTNMVTGKENPEVLSAHVDHLYATHPDLLRETYYWGAILARQHHDPRVIAAMEKWWDLFITYSRRDELSLTEALLEMDGDFQVFHGHINQSDFHRWPTELGRPPGPRILTPDQLSAISSPYLELAYYMSLAQGSPGQEK